MSSDKNNNTITMPDQNRSDTNYSAGHPADAEFRELIADIDAYLEDHFEDHLEDLEFSDNSENMEDMVCLAPHLLNPEDSEQKSRHVRNRTAETREFFYGGTAEATAQPARAGDLDSLIGHLDEPFSDTLLRLIDARGLTDVEVYKKAGIDRKLFSKIRRGKGYIPGKRTILALTLAMGLNLEETDDLLKRAGYALSHSSKFDVIVEYYICHGKSDLDEINEVLYYYDQPLLN